MKRFHTLMTEDCNTSETISEIANKAPKNQTPLRERTPFIIAVIFLIIGGFVALGFISPILTYALIFVSCAALLFYSLWATKSFESVEAYISAPRYRKASPFLREIHERVLAVSPNITTAMYAAAYFDTYILPTYLYVKDAEKEEFYPVLVVWALLGRRNIRISVSPSAYANFADRIKGYKMVDVFMLMPLAEPFDYELITDMVRFTIMQNSQASEQG